MGIKTGMAGTPPLPLKVGNKAGNKAGNKLGSGGRAASQGCQLPLFCPEALGLGGGA